MELHRLLPPPARGAVLPRETQQPSRVTTQGNHPAPGGSKRWADAFAPPRVAPSGTVTQTMLAPARLALTRG